MNKYYGIIATTIALMASMVLCKHRISSPTKSAAAKIDQLMQAYHAIGNFSGAVLVAKEGKILCDKAYGIANYELDVPNTIETKFRIASLSKQFTAMAILQLQEQGLLNINDLIAKYLPDYPHGNEITVLHLLNHRSGIPDHQQFADYPVISRITASLSEVIDAFKNKPLEFKPGSQFQYSDSNYILLTAIIEKVSGDTYSDYLHNHIFKRTDMHDSGVERNQDIIKKKAAGYALRLEDDVLFNANYLDMSFEQGAGMIYSTIHDLYRWDQALYTDNILRQKTFRHIYSTTQEEQYVCGWVMDSLFGKPRMWHIGRGGGFTAVIQRFVEDNACIIILSNFNFTWIDEIANKLAAIIFGQPYDLPQKRTVIKIDPALYDAYVGTYVHPDFTVVVTKKDGYLYIQPTGQPDYMFFPESETDFFSKESGASVSFAKNSNGQINQILIHQDGQELQAQKEHGLIILLNGTSSVGKTSIVSELQKIYGNSYVTMLGDDFVNTYSIQHPKPDSMTNDAYQVQVLSALCKQVKQLSLEGKNVVVELVQFDENYEHYCSILDCLKVVKILVYCPLDIVIDRLAKRNKTADLKVDLLTPVQLFAAIYKVQEAENELVVDRIRTSRMNYALQAAAQEINTLMQEAGVHASFEEDPFYKDFIKRFALDDDKEITLVPIHPWDLIINSGVLSPQECALIITQYLQSRALSAVKTAGGTYQAASAREEVE